MKFSEAMLYYDFNGAEIARNLGITRQNLRYWKKIGFIPLHHQHTLEQLTNGELKADSENDIEAIKINRKRTT